MARGKRRHTGGRKFDLRAKRRFTTRFGRKHGYEPADPGSELLRKKKHELTSREDLELTGSAVLHGHGYLDREQYDKLGWITRLLQQVARSFGRGASPAGVWAAIIAAASRTTPGMPDVVGDFGARRALERILQRLDGSRALVLELAAEGPLPPICVRAAGHRLSQRDTIQLELLRKGLDGISVRTGGEAD
jgi:hypothetical protein